ncbi:GMC oxidoreductase domain-containing protein [Phthorimaea operculella]|nr:GMC oxidoreductase domain-containing protein [Phthorimaea operculella]
MEGLATNLATACPLPFSGVTGNLFAGAVAAVVAAQCAFYDNYDWPIDYADQVIGKRSEPAAFDFLVVGAGTAGSLLANRLAKSYPSQTVLVIEAGGDPGLDTEVPAFVFLNKVGDLDWQYETQAEGKYCKGFKNNNCIWSNGKGLGGSNAINVMLYIRGHPQDYNNWESYGNKEWGYKDVSKHFAKIEKDFEFSKYNYTENPWYGALEATWLEVNLTAHAKPSNEALLGVRVNKLLVKNGRRINPARMYLNGPKNLFVMKNTLVQKVIIDPESKTATGVQVRHKSGVVMEIKAHKEVILSAGSIATPQLLMLSGIGPKKHLEEKNIECLLDLPVGQNLQDHTNLPLFFKSNLDTIVTKQMVTTYLLQYMLTRTGPFSNVGITDFMAFVNTEGKRGSPDVQYHHTYYPMKDNLVMKPFLEYYGYKKEIVDAIVNLNEKCDLLGIFPTVLHPKSRGEVLLADKDPASKPIIKPNYFQHPEDMKTLLKSIEFINKVENTTVFQALGIKLTELEIKECDDYVGDDYWTCYIQHMASTLFHPVGTAKMGPKEDKEAVVDPNLLVHGMKNLRVVDASIMPDIPGGNTMGPTFMIAEKASEIINKQYKVNDKDEL